MSSFTLKLRLIAGNGPVQFPTEKITVFRAKQSDLLKWGNPTDAGSLRLGLILFAKIAG